MEAATSHAALLCSPGIGHLIPVLQLAETLATTHAFRVTLFVVTLPTSSSQEAELLGDTATFPDVIDVVQLPAADISSMVPADAAVVTRLAFMMREACAPFRSAIAALKPPPSVFIADFFGYEALEIARELHLPKYLYFPSSAWFFALTSYLPVLDKDVEGEYVDEIEPLPLPGCKPVRPGDVVDPMLDRSNQQYEELLKIAAGALGADGFLLNTWDDIEPETLKAIRENETYRELVQVPVYPIGPLVRPSEPGGSASEFMSWLDGKPADSVIYVSFGSGGTLSSEQMEELAWGLVGSGHNFIWVVRRPTIAGDASGAFFGSGEPADVGPLGYLPEGFLAQTEGVGLSVANWAPQRAILGHAAVGGFVSHCGWNSTMESVMSGVPMIGWPLYAEQRMNAALLAENMGVAIRPEKAALMGRREVERMVRKLMGEEGMEMRKRVKQVQRSALRALAENGSSSNALCRVVEDCRRGRV